MKHERSLISVIHGLLTNSWNDESNSSKSELNKRINAIETLAAGFTYCVTYDCIQDHEQSRKRLASLVATSHPAKKRINDSLVLSFDCEYRDMKTSHLHQFSLVSQ